MEITCKLPSLVATLQQERYSVLDQTGYIYLQHVPELVSTTSVV